LNIQALPSVGSELFFEARAKVIGSRQSATEHSDDLSLELQITHMDVEADEGDDDDDLSRETQTPMSRVAKKMKFM
jgi:hypothetical protein